MVYKNPIFGSDTKAQIMEIIKQEKQINAKKIFNRLGKHYNSPITYQATHKILKKMLEEGLLVKEELEYKINPEWVEELGEYLTELVEAEVPSARKIISQLDRGQTVQFTVKKEIHMARFLLDFLNLAAKKTAEPIVMHLQFTWTLMPLDEKQRQILEECARRNGVFVLSHDSFFWDKWASKQWEHIGAKIKIGQKNFAKQNDTLVIGDYIVNIFWEEQHLSWVRSDSLRVKNEKDLDINVLFEMILDSETKIDFIIRKDKVAARKIIYESMEQFRR